jgi:S-adenosylmethionine synthetase
MSEPHLFTSESVTEGHPDKVADQISDGILDAILAGDPNGRVAAETLVTTGLAFISGEITTRTYVEIPSLVREIIRDIGYTDSSIGFDADTCSVVTSIDDQSGDIAMGVDTGGAGDQGLMFGYACRETPELMPMPILLAHRVCERLARLRKNGKLDYLRPDGKSQVTVEYEDNHPARIDTVVVSTQHHPDVKTRTIREDVIEHVLKPILPRKLVDWKKVKIFVNPTGRFVNGGPKADTGLTGRKIIVDTYGGMGSHGGGALSGKDPSKVDRSACYAARWVAKNLVAAELCDRVEVQLAYAIGVAQPVSIMCDTMGTGVMPDSQITRLVRKHFDLTPAGIMRDLKLRRPIYRKTAAYGHFGREDAAFTWEKTSRAKDLRRGV